jgi:putative FmdB family regulatory protein
MVRYEYRCPGCGPWVVAIPMGSAEAERPCPGCGQRSPRLWSAPSLNRMSAGLSGLRLREEASRDAPEVTTAVPKAARRPRRTDPRHTRLPRP